MISGITVNISFQGQDSAASADLGAASAPPPPDNNATLDYAADKTTDQALLPPGPVGGDEGLDMAADIATDMELAPGPEEATASLFATGSEAIPGPMANDAPPGFNDADSPAIDSGFVPAPVAEYDAMEDAAPPPDFDAPEEVGEDPGAAHQTEDNKPGTSRRKK